MSAQLKFLEMPNSFNLGFWRSSGRQMVKAHEILQWELGDWLIEGKDDGQLDDKRLRQEAEKATKLAWGTLKNYMVTARAIPPARDGAP
jgi:hypothetical protein